MSRKIVGRECRFATHVYPKRPDCDDMHVVKEIVHYDDGTVEPRLNYIKNYKRPLYVTKKGYQNHQQKKEHEYLDRLDRYECTQSELRYAIARALGKEWSREGLKQLCSSPYVYGTDITASALIKHEYKQKYPTYNTRYTLATLDLETDVLNGVGDIILGSTAFEKNVHLVFRKDFLNGIDFVKEKATEKFRRYLKDYINPDEYTFTVDVVDDEIALLKSLFKKIHSWKPDWLAIWNIDFDMPKMLAACARFSVNPEDIFCDPSVPEDYRYFNYKPGPKKKATASGKVMPIKPASQWHATYCTATFTFIDAMCSFKHIRLAKQEEGSYALNYILQKFGIPRKLQFEEADQFTGLDWHKFMQSYYKLEYGIYCNWDSLSMLQLDEKTKDLAFTLPTLSQCADFDIFKSQPKRIATAYHFHAINNNSRVLAATGSTTTFSKKLDELAESADDDEEDEVEDKGIAENLKNWIVTLQPEYLVPNGLRCIEECPTMPTNIYIGVTDIDVTSAYPSATEGCNVSKETTRFELICVKGIDNRITKLNNINLLSGHVNALDYCVTMFGFPKPKDLLELYLKQKK